MLAAAQRSVVCQLLLALGKNASIEINALLLMDKSDPVLAAATSALGALSRQRNLRRLRTFPDRPILVVGARRYVAQKRKRLAVRADPPILDLPVANLNSIAEQGLQGRAEEGPQRELVDGDLLRRRTQWVSDTGAGEERANVNSPG